MASSSSLVCFFLLLTTLFCSLQTHARDMQFFSKVSRDRDDTTTDANKVNDVKPLAKQTKQPEEEQPAFLPQTTHTGYGLYGHEPTTTSTTTTPSSLYNMDDEKYENQNNFNIHNNREIIGNNRNEKSYVPELTGLSETSYTNNVGYVAENRYDSNNNNNEVNQNGKNYQPELSGLGETTSYTNNVGSRNYVAENNLNNFNNNNNEMFGNSHNQYEKNNDEVNQNGKNYQPELSGLGETTSYTNNVGSSNYYNNKNNFNNNNNNEMFGNSQNQYEKNNVGPSKYVAENNYNNNYYHNNVNNNNEMFENTQNQDVSSSKYVGENNYYKNYKKNGEGNYNGGRRYNGGVEKQGMSDTRYLENGKYFYDINAEKELYPTNNNNDMSYNNNNNNNNGQLYGNRVDNHELYYNHNNVDVVDNNNYKYNGNGNGNGNGMQQGYKNQFPKEEEFEFDDQP